MKPVVTIGSGGLSEAVLDEFTRSLEHHELMKLKVSLGDRGQRDAALRQVCEHSGAQLIQRVGNVGLLFRKKKKGSRFPEL